MTPTAKLVIPFIFLVYQLASAATVEDRIAKIYPSGGSNSEPAFIQKIHIESENENTRTAVSTIEDRDGKTIMREKVRILNGVTVEQEMEQLQVGEVYRLKVENGRAYFKTFKVKDGKEILDEDGDEPLKENFSTGPALEIYLKSQKERLLKDEPVKVSFGIFEVSRSVEFEYKKTAIEGDKVHIKMEPASFWLSLLVTTMQLDFDKDSWRLLRFKGRTPLRQKIKDKWKPVDAEIFYETSRSRT